MIVIDVMIDNDSDWWIHCEMMIERMINEWLIYLTGIEEIGFLHFIRVHTRGNSNHPQEFVNIISAVANETTENDKNVIHIQTANDGVGFILAAGQCLMMKWEMNV